MEGGCTCRQVRYRLTGTPLIVHACHCRWCQRETGTAHALNALYEADRVAHIAGEPEIVLTPSASGKGQMIARYPTCKVAVWSNYPQAGSAIRFVRVGTMDDPDRCPPDIHIFTSSKQPWVTCRPAPKSFPNSMISPTSGLSRALSAAESCARRCRRQANFRVAKQQDAPGRDRGRKAPLRFSSQRTAVPTQHQAKRSLKSPRRIYCPGQSAFQVPRNGHEPSAGPVSDTFEGVNLGRETHSRERQATLRSS